MAIEEHSVSGPGGLGPVLQAALLQTALNAIASPKRPEPLQRETTAADGTVEPKPTPALLGEAFREFLERYPADRLPSAGGINATVVVTMTLETLLGGIQAAGKVRCFTTAQRTALRVRHRTVHLPGHTATYDGAVTRITKIVERRQ